MSRRRGALACLALVALLAGCGGGGGNEQTVSADGLRDCLAKHGVSFGQREPGTASFFSLAVDLQGSVGHTQIAASVQRDAAAAKRAAADARGALGSVGVAPGGPNVVQRQNVVVLFNPAPSPAARAAVNACLAGS